MKDLQIFLYPLVMGRAVHHNPVPTCHFSISHTSWCSSVANFQFNALNSCVPWGHYSNMLGVNIIVLLLLGALNYCIVTLFYRTLIFTEGCGNMLLINKLCPVSCVLCPVDTQDSINKAARKGIKTQCLPLQYILKPTTANSSDPHSKVTFSFLPLIKQRNSWSTIPFI